MMPGTMKHLLSGVAIVAALAVAVPVWAQTAAPMTPSSGAPAAAAPATAPAPAAKARHKRVSHSRVSHSRVSHSKAMRRGTARRTSPDNIANQLNAQELARVGSSSAPDMAGSRGYGQPNPAQSGAAGNLEAPGTLGGGYGQPAPTQGIPGGNQPSASSHPRY
jgi:hypothetical protein